MSVITTPISLSWFSQARILCFTVQMLSAGLGSIAIAQPESAHAINFLKTNNTSIQGFTQRPILLAQFAVAPPSASILYVNSQNGIDTDNSSDLTPFKTITHALKVAQSGTTILLAPGTYSTETGETFPLVLKAGVTLQGDPATRGQDILIQGGGASTHKTLAQSLTIEITSPATLNGVTVTNPNPQGYGVGIGSSNPAIANSSFTENGYGLVIVGNSNARIQNNYFYQNRIAGIEVANIAQPTIQDNIFEQTGSAVIVSDRATPLIANNRMTQNQNGMVFQGSAQPIVRNNSVEGNRQYGLLTKETSRPDLGTTANPGGNFFRNNGLLDVDVSATNQVISAVGNEWLNAVGTLKTTHLMPAASNSAIAFPVPSALSSNPTPEPPRPMQLVQIAMPSAQYNQISPLQSAHSSLETFPLPPSSSQQVTRPAILAKSSALKPIQKNQLATLPLVTPIATSIPKAAIAPIPIAIPVPPPETITVRPEIEIKPTRSIKAMDGSLKTSKNASVNLLPVPSPNIPMGKIGEMPSVYSMRGVFQPSPMQSPTFSSNNPKVGTVRFRVVVDAKKTEQAQVLTLVPDAFLIASTSKVMIQVGAFSDRTKAEQLTRILAGQGIASTIESINP